MRATAPRQRAAIDVVAVRRELLDLARRWRRTLQEEPRHARPIVTMLLKGRVTLTAIVRKKWHLQGAGTIAGLFEAEIFPSVWLPHTELFPIGRPFYRVYRAA